MGQIVFNRKNRVSCNNVSIWRIIIEYVWWVLAGKPDGHNMEVK